LSSGPISDRNLYNIAGATKKRQPEKTEEIDEVADQQKKIAASLAGNIPLCPLAAPGSLPFSD